MSDSIQNKSNLALYGARPVSALEKQALIGGILESIAPETTREFLRPAWHGLQAARKAGTPFSIDNYLKAMGKGVEAHRFNNMPAINRLRNLGVKFNTDVQGAPVGGIDFGGTLKGVGTKALNWVKENPGKTMAGLAGIYGVSQLLNRDNGEIPQSKPVNYSTPDILPKGQGI